MRTTALITGERTILDACAELARHLAQRGHLPTTRRRDDGGVLLAYYPLARRNPYQSLLYSRALDHGVACLPVRRWQSLVELPWTGTAVCHLHWINSVLAGAESARAADARIAEFVEVLDELRHQGRRIVWTVHNVLPHDAPQRDKEAVLRRALVERCDVVHAMTSDTAERVREHFEIPEEKLCVVRHPSYAGVYPDHVTRAAARSELGLDEDDFAFLLFGSIQPYKGVDELMAAFDALAERSGSHRRPVLLIAGQPSDAALGERIRAWGGGRTDVRLADRSVPTEEVQHWFRAADISVLPYRQVLNSGAAMLSMTFGVPFLAPRLGAFAGLGDEGCGTCYDPAADDGLVAAMARAMEGGAGVQSCDIGRSMSAFTPDTVSDQFFRDVLERAGVRP